MSASGMIDGIITNLCAASVLGASGASTDYYVLETTSACCAVVGWINDEFVPQTFGAPMEGGKTHTILIQGYIRDNNDPVAIMKNNAGFIDLLMDSLISDSTLQDSINVVRRIFSTRNPDEMVSAGGLTWIPTNIEVTGFEFTD